MEGSNGTSAVKRESFMMVSINLVWSDNASPS